MRRGFLLCFTGMDGTGKTTYALSTKNYLEDRGFKCKYIWFPYGLSIAFSFLVVAFAWLLLGRKRPIDKEIPKNRALVYIWLLSSILDYSLYILFSILPRLYKNTLICDRYIYDVLVRLKFFGIHSKKLTRVLLVIAQRPNFIFLLDTPEKVALSRKKEGSLEYYAKQRRLYIETLDEVNLNYKIINTDENYHKTYSEIVSYLDSNIK